MYQLRQIKRFREGGTEPPAPALRRGSNHQPQKPPPAPRPTGPSPGDVAAPPHPLPRCSRRRRRETRAPGGRQTTPGRPQTTDHTQHTAGPHPGPLPWPRNGPYDLVSGPSPGPVGPVWRGPGHGPLELAPGASGRRGEADARAPRTAQSGPARSGRPRRRASDRAPSGGDRGCAQRAVAVVRARARAARAALAHAAPRCRPPADGGPNAPLASRSPRCPRCRMGLPGRRQRWRAP